MNAALQYGIVFAASLLLALVGTPLVRAAALRLGAVDAPDHRRMHLAPTPLLGGVAIFGAAISGMALVKAFQGPALGGLLGASLILLVGLWDDLYRISPRNKLLGQIAAAAVLLPFGISIEITGLAWLDGAITVFWVVGICNAFNLLDNMDGLSAGVAAVAAFCFFVVAAQGEQFIVAGASLALCGACLGFLRYNFGRAPARIFMGDTGSLLLGYLLAVLAVRLVYDSPRWITPLVPIAILGVPILDTTFVVICRLKEGRPISQGGKDHLSHRLVAAFGLPPRNAVAALWLAAATLGASAVFQVTRHPLAGILAAGLLVAVGGVLLALSRKRRLLPAQQEQHDSR